MVPVFGWASWPVKDIVAPWPVFQADPIEGIGGRKRPEVDGAQNRFSAGRAPDDLQARELYPTLPRQLRACEGGLPQGRLN